MTEDQIRFEKRQSVPIMYNGRPFGVFYWESSLEKWLLQFYDQEVDFDEFGMEVSPYDLDTTKLGEFEDSVMVDLSKMDFKRFADPESARTEFIHGCKMLSKRMSKAIELIENHIL